MVLFYLLTHNTLVLFTRESVKLSFIHSQVSLLKHPPLTMAGLYYVFHGVFLKCHLLENKTVFLLRINIKTI